MKIHNDTVKDLNDEGELIATYRLLRKVGTKEKAYQIFDEINWYPGEGHMGKALGMIAAEDGATKKLDTFFSKI